MIILGIETSCDDTAVAIVKDGKEILCNKIHSQSDLHSAAFGGVFPEMASRWHLDAIAPVLKEALTESDLSIDMVDAIAVTQGPGLIGSLLIGLEFAKGLSWSRNLPLIGVNHLHAHLYAAAMSALEEISLPALGLVVSGGHTAIFLIHSWENIQPIATTRDDAVGEAFDKVAKMLSLGYPGGPIIEALAKEGDPHKIPFRAGNFKEAPLDFSLSGLKTQILRYLQEHKEPSIQDKKNLAASFQETVIEDVVHKIRLASQMTKIKQVLIGGGVACNKRFQEELIKQFEGKVFLPTKSLTSDNAAMVAGLGYHLALSGKNVDLTCEPYARALDKKGSFALSNPSY